ncbi:MAG: redoxin domain-containing protein [Deltaproteobacteria bacterium]|nr:redoxin domain-containing protein [Deltaproteobacteria bacterium]
MRVLAGLVLVALTVVTQPALGASNASGRAWLGVAMRSGPAGGVVVDYVFKTSPAAKAALKEGDMLVRADGAPLDKPSDMVTHVRRRRPGMSVKLVVRRGGRERPVTAVLESHPGDEALVRLMHVGNAAPELEQLTPVRGKVPGAIKDLKGKVAIIHFWASWCTSCRLMTPTLAKWNQRYGKRGVTVLGITSDAPGPAKETAQRWKMTYAVASDGFQKTASAYRVDAIPAAYVVDRKGVIREVLIGYDPTRRAAIEKLIETLLAKR